MCYFSKHLVGARNFKKRVGGRKMCKKDATEWAETSQQGDLCWKDSDWGGARSVDQ